MHGQKPFMKGNMGAFHYGAGADGELVAAIVALEHSALRFALHAGDVG